MRQRDRYRQTIFTDSENLTLQKVTIPDIVPLTTIHEHGPVPVFYRTGRACLIWTEEGRFLDALFEFAPDDGCIEPPLTSFPHFEGGTILQTTAGVSIYVGGRIDEVFVTGACAQEGMDDSDGDDRGAG